MPKYRYTIMYDHVGDEVSGKMKVVQDYVDAETADDAARKFHEIVDTYDNVVDGYMEDDPFELCPHCNKMLYSGIQQNFCQHCGGKL